jgi:opacity protein-like surface antigen
MKKIVISLAALIFCTAGTAQALEGFYIAPKLGYSQLNFDDPRAAIPLSDKEEGVWGGGLALGYDMRMMQEWMLPLRLEVEGFFREGAEEDWDTQLGPVSNRARVTTLFANAFFDIPLGLAFTPYVGGGLGMAFVDYKTSLDLALLNGIAGSNSDDQTNFAWNIGAGVAYSFTQNIALDFNYRYVNAGEGRVDVAGIRSDSDIFLHEFLLGLRLTFR